MSLNGLDATAIQSAYQTASVEAGGWFLLKYTSRDSVELLARGHNGVHEARNAIAKYEEQSPLYGLIIYRRRKVLIKFIPQGTSRLLQARTAVHFQDILERYSPYETLLEISHADGLNDTSLASSFPLHTASPSASSSRLHEISEDGEDPGSMPKAIRAHSGTGSIFGTRQYKMERRVDQLMRPSDRPTPTIHISDELSPRASSPLAGAAKPSISQFLVRDESGKRSITSLTSPSASTFSEYAGSNAGSETSTTKEPESTISSAEPAKEEEESARRIEKALPSTLSAATQPSVPKRSNELPVIERVSSITSERSVAMSSEAAAKASEREVPTASTNTQDLSNVSERAITSERLKPGLDEEPYDFSYLEPKPKVKLGPRLVSTSEKTKRPPLSVSAIPAGFRPVAKKAEQPRPKSQISVIFAQPQSMPSLPAPPPIPDLPEYNPRPLSRGSVKSLPSHKSTGMTPDKLRLMKAVELRKKQLRKSNPQLKAPRLDKDVPEVPKSVPAPPREEAVHSPKKISEITNPTLDALSQVATKKPDSGISMGFDERGQNAVYAEIVLPAAKETPGPESSSAERVSDLLQRNQLHHETKQPARETSPSLELHQDTSNEAPQVADVLHPAAPKSPALSHKSIKVDRPRSPSPNPSLESPPPFQSDVLKKLKASDTTSDDSPTLGRTVDIPAFSTSLEHLITGGPESQITADTRPTAAHSPTDPSKDEDTPRSPSEDRSALEQLQKGEQSSLPLAGPPKHSGDLAKRRRGIVEPLHIDVDKSGPSDGEFGSEDEFFEELKSATLHEAKPMSVSKSPGPGAQFFQRRPSNQSLVSRASQSDSPLRAINVVNGVAYSPSEVSPEQPQQRTTREASVSPERTAYPQPARSGSASHNSPLQERQDPLANLRRNVSDGITRRWQALAEQSSREASPPAVHMPTRPMTPETKANTFIANDRRPTLASPRSRTSSYRGRVRTGNERTSAYGGSLSQLESAPVWNTLQDGTSNRDSVSVKARIVRPQSTTFEQAKEGAEPEPTALQSPQIEISHRRGIPTPTSLSQAFLPPLEQFTSALPPVPPQPSAPAGRDSPEHRFLHSAHRKSFGRNKALPNPSPGALDEIPTPPMSPHFSSGNPSIDENTAPANAGSRTSRFFKRMSNIGHPSKRRSAAAQSVHSNAGGATNDAVVSRNGSVAVVEKDRSDMPPAVAIGDLNVQFPDTLLWKRRALFLTETGHLFLSVPSSEHSRASLPPKRYHLSDFKAPYTPDLDRQELPWSIWLEFNAGDGGVLQVACEDQMGRGQVLMLLKGYWKAWVA